MRRGLLCHNHGCGRPHEEESISAHLWIVRGRVREVSRVALRDAAYVVQGGEGRAAADPRLLAWQCTRGCRSALLKCARSVCTAIAASWRIASAGSVSSLKSQTCSAGRHCNARGTLQRSGRALLMPCCILASSVSCARCRDAALSCSPLDADAGKALVHALPCH